MAQADAEPQQGGAPRLHAAAFLVLAIGLLAAALVAFRLLTVPPSPDAGRA